MPFNNYKSVEKVLLEFSFVYKESNFIELRKLEIDSFFVNKLQTVVTEGVVFNSEYAICENIISPILTEIWQIYKDKCLLWSHQPLSFDQNLSGIPDYIVAKLSPRGKIILEKPYLVLVEAKKDNFEEGWGQCFAELIAVQKINDNPHKTVFGIVSNGKLWEFAKLEAEIFTKNINSYLLDNLETLMEAINFVFTPSI